MKKFFICFVAILTTVTTCRAADFIKDEIACSKADNVIGEYHIEHEGESNDVRIYKCKNGTYSCQMINGAVKLDKNGNIKLDTKNPNPALRKKPAHRIIVVWDLKYNPEKKRWEDGTIYDPRFGFTANCTMEIGNDNKTLRVRGSLFGIGKTLYWTRIK